MSDWGQPSSASNAFGDAEAVDMGKLMEAGAIVPGYTATESGIPILSVVTSLSIAISLKRIADMLDSSEGGGRPQGSILYFLEMIASAAQAGRS